jgi:large subunit ribosomal protein L20
MARVKRSVVARTRRNKIMKLAKGFFGRSKNCYRSAKPSVERALKYAYRDRRARRRNFRALWIQRINAASRLHGLTYSQFINGLNKAGVQVDRKVMADLAVFHENAFKALVEKANTGLAQAKRA